MRNVLPVFLLGFTVTGFAAEGEFRPKRAQDYPARQTVSQVTIAADVFETEEQAKPLFGKNHPYRFGVLPILIVMENQSPETISLENLKVQYRYASGQTVEPTPAAEVPFLRPPTSTGIPNPGPIPGSGRPSLSRKNPLNNPQIEARAFAARMLPPGDQAHGFFYFRCGHRRDSILYVSGLRQASTGQELFFFEIPLPAPR